MRYSFDDAGGGRAAATTQYFEMFCNRGIYHEGWTAVTRHSTPWVDRAELPPFDGRRLGALRHDQGLEAGARPRRRDAGEARRAAGALARGGAEVQRPARSTTGGSSASTPTSPGRPVLVRGNSQLLFGGMGRLSENVVLNVKNKSHAVTAEIDVPDARRRTACSSPRAARSRGWSLYVKDGEPKYCYNFLGLQTFTVEGDAAIPPGTHQVRMEFAYDGGGLAKGGERDAVRRRREGRRGARRGDRADDVLRRRDRRRRRATPPRP